MFELISGKALLWQHTFGKHYKKKNNFPKYLFYIHMMLLTDRVLSGMLVAAA